VPAAIQRSVAVVALVILSPLLALLSVAVRLSSPGPALHRATRVCPGGTFTLFKFRTMRAEKAPSGPAITAAGDPRVTRLGRILRASKLDELPQLWNVARGEMVLVGPRPEDPRYVDLDDPLSRTVFTARPGITGPTALAYRDEETILAKAAQDLASAQGRDRATDEDLDRAYREIVLPAKLELDAQYLRTRSTRGDLVILGKTIGQVLRRSARR
jgi:lipopolysaccharide/colanic/teichoic acid biosynthesis glycosyltransferase